MRTHRSLLTSSFICALTVLSSTPCLASPDALTDKAATLYDEGMAAYAKHKWPEARASFLAAWALHNHWQIAGSLGDCEVQLGLYRDAATHLAYFLRLAPPANRSATATRLFDVARSKVGTIALTIDVDGADIALDGNVIGKAPLKDPVFVEPGHHQVEARSGPTIASAQVNVPAGSTQPVPLSLKSKGSDPVPPSGHRSVVPGAVLGGVAGLALVPGIGLVVAGANKHATDTSLNHAILQAHHSCVTGAANFDPQCSTLESSSSTADALGRAGLGVLIGAGALAVGSVVYFLWPESKPRTLSSGGALVVPVVSTNSGGMFVSGAF